MSRPNSRPETKSRLAGIAVALPVAKPAPPPETPASDHPSAAAPPRRLEPPKKALTDLRGTARFVLYLADHIEDACKALPEHEANGEAPPHLNHRLLEMYTAALVAKSQALGSLSSDVARTLRSAEK